MQASLLCSPGIHYAHLQDEGTEAQHIDMLTQTHSQLSSMTCVIFCFSWLCTHILPTVKTLHPHNYRGFTKAECNLAGTK